MAALKPGPGVETVRNNCSVCHSTDYIVRQPGGDARHWEPEVRKMIAIYGAQLSEADVQVISTYLGTQYGSTLASAQSPAAPAQPPRGPKKP
jgi:sulfite dehydrogenase (cytochrome) subunit B